MVSDLDRKALAACKPEVLERLTSESRLLSMSLDEFEQQDLSMEVTVPWLDKTLWFVPRRDHAARVCADGVAPGRVLWI